MNVDGVMAPAPPVMGLLQLPGGVTPHAPYSVSKISETSEFGSGVVSSSPSEKKSPSARSSIVLRQHPRVSSRSMTLFEQASLQEPAPPGSINSPHDI